LNAPDLPDRCCTGPAPESAAGSWPWGASNRIDVESELDVYAIVRAGGRQEKVSVGDVLTVDKLDGEAGSTIELQPLLLVDGAAVISSASVLANVKVTAEIVEPTKGPKITIMKFKNKTGYRKRQGHRQQLTRIKVTGISK
jgi:large subunit ribosomal protein L21